MHLVERPARARPKDRRDRANPLAQTRQLLGAQQCARNCAGHPLLLHAIVSPSAGPLLGLLGLFTFADRLINIRGSQMGFATPFTLADCLNNFRASQMGTFVAVPVAAW